MFQGGRFETNRPWENSNNEDQGVHVEHQIMNSIETLTTFFGWCTVINLAVILLVLLRGSVLREPVGKLNAKIFGISREEAKGTFFRVFMQYRIAFAVLNVVPYLALKIMA